MGAGTKASGYYSTAMGRYNKVDDTSLFVIGNGDWEASRNNALEIKYDGTIVGNANNMSVNNTALLDIINNQQRQIDLLLGYIQPMKSCNCSVGLLQCDNVSHVVDSYKILNQCGL